MSYAQENNYELAVQVVERLIAGVWANQNGVVIDEC